jgi:hypothetical protein
VNGHATRVRWVARVRRLRAPLASLGVLGIAVALVLAGPGAQTAQAVTVSPIGPVTVLPSTLPAPPVGLTGSAVGDYTAGTLYNLVKSGNLRILYEAAQAYPTTEAAVAAGALTSTEAATVTAAVAAETVPVTTAAGLTTAGAAAAGANILTAGYMGFALTNGVLRAVNVTTDGLVCGQTGTDPIGSLTRLATGTDCGKLKPSGSFVPNGDQTPVNGTAQACTADGTFCLFVSQVAEGTFTSTASGPTVYHHYRSFCLSGSGLTNGAAFQYHLAGDADTVRRGGTVQTTDGWNPPSAADKCKAGGWWYLEQDVTSTTATPALARTALPDKLTVIPQASGVSWSSQPAAQQAGGTTTVPNPSRTMSCVTAGSDGVTYTGTGVSFTEADTVLPVPPCKPLPPGVSPRSVKLVEATPSTGTTQDLTTQNVTVPNGGFAECSSQLCLLELHKGSKVCFSSPADCVGWFTSPTKTNDYQCTYGGHSVGLTECNIYATSFPQATPTADYLAGPDGSPLPNPNTSDVASPVTDPGANTEPNASGQPVSPNQDCFGNVYGTFDPVGWVLTPIKCAALWAFVPTDPPDPGAIKAQFDATQPAQLAAALDLSGLAVPSGCSGFLVQPWWQSSAPPVHILDACGAPWAEWASTSRVFFYVAFSVIGIVGFTRAVGGLFGAPGLGRADGDG